MRTDYKDFAAQLNRSFPKTPERFQQIVSQEVCAQMNHSKNIIRKKDGNSIGSCCQRLPV